MRADRALEIAADPLEHDLDDVAAALIALAVEVRELRRRREEDRAALIEASATRRDRANLVGQRAAAVQLADQADERLVEVLALLDVHAPEVARQQRGMWGIWPHSTG